MPIPPLQSKGPQFAPDPDKQQTAQHLSESTKAFIKETEDFLKSPNLADNEQSLSQYAETVIKLSEISNEALGE